MTETIELKRECEVIAIPSGLRQKLPLGTVVRIVQSRGGSYTVSTNFHAMYRIDAKDADALGLTLQASANKPAQQGPLTEEMVWDTLKTVFDPEIPVNIVDLGLVYSCEISVVEGGKKVSVRMSLTAPGCGMSNVLKADVESRLMRLPEVAKADVEIVFDPPWTQDRMSDAARLQLGFDFASPSPQKLTQIS